MNETCWKADFNSRGGVRRWWWSVNVAVVKRGGRKDNRDVLTCRGVQLHRRAVITAIAPTQMSDPPADSHSP
jgi:hypothetical protein